MKKGSILIDEEKQVETQTRTASLQPERKQTKKDMLERRVVVICPYGPLNAFFESEIPNVDEKTTVEIIWHAVSKEPYFNVDSHEKQKQPPYVIIDFKKLIAYSHIEMINEEERKLNRHKAVHECVDHFTQKIKPEEIDLSLREEKSRYSERMKCYLRDKLEKHLEKELGELIEEADKKSTNKREIQGIVPFHGYQKWSRGRKLVYASPKEHFTQELEEREVYEDANFVQNRLDFSPFLHHLKQDIKNILKGDAHQLNLFRAEYSPSQKEYNLSWLMRKLKDRK